ncbi:MAG: hypothetical protein NPIRA02_37580 [Nitrospirales bacterium]|nr:MAG: hypothetical protein NPIRA02_37580 [Nitrospirales bacterium]
MKTNPLRIERFLNEMDQVVPWQQLEAVIQPHSKSTSGRPPHELRDSFSPTVASLE